MSKAEHIIVHSLLWIFAVTIGYGTFSTLDTRLKFTKQELVESQKNLNWLRLVTEKHISECDAHRKFLEEGLHANSVDLENRERSLVAIISVRFSQLQRLYQNLSNDLDKVRKELGPVVGNVDVLKSVLLELQNELEQVKGKQKDEDLEELKQHYLNTQVLVTLASATGSGTLLPGNRVLTAEHVVRSAGAGKVIVDVPGLKSSIPATIVMKSVALDLALLQLDYKPELPCVRLMAKDAFDNLPELTKVISAGYPIGRGPYFTEGRLVIKRTVIPGHGPRIISSALMFFGSSGGGLFDAKTGELIGVTVSMPVAGMSPVNFMGASVPLDLIVDWFESNKVPLDGM